MLSCTRRDVPVGRCVVGEKDLLPGQEFVGRLFAVNTASTDCFSYSFEAARSCGADRTFDSGNGLAYDSCETLPVGRDTDGCAKLPGYTFYQGWVLSDTYNWRMEDSTQWALLANPVSARQAAALDMPLMASRCTAEPSCAAFQNTGNGTDLLYQLPDSRFWVRVPDSDSQASRCFGIYQKTPPPSSCARIPGYLFIPLHTLDVDAAGAGTGDTGGSGFVVPAGAGPCSTCRDNTALAVQCDAYSGAASCAGFSNYHGLITAGGLAGGLLLSDQPLSQFTLSPCAGLFLRAGRDYPHEVEQLDQLLCGEFVYCTTQLRYHASGQSAVAASGATTTTSTYYVDISVDFLSDFTLPLGLQDASGAGLRQLPSVRSLVLRCRNGAVMYGGVPLAFTALMPFLQELRLQGCRIGGPLPPELARLRYLRALDLSVNAFTGGLPDAWSNMSLGYLNLSSNLLSGTLPKSWRGILTMAPAAPSPAPQAGVLAALPPPPPAVAQLAEQGALLVADLSANALQGAVDRQYVYDSCVDQELRLQLQGDPPAQLVAALGQGGSPTFLLQGNPGVAAWAGGYKYAVADIGGGMSGGSSNLCGSYQYKIALGILWGVFGVCLLAIILWSTWSACATARAARRSQFFISNTGAGADSEEEEGEAERQEDDRPGAAGGSGGGAAARGGGDGGASGDSGGLAEASAAAVAPATAAAAAANDARCCAGWAGGGRWASGCSCAGCTGGGGAAATRGRRPVACLSHLRATLSRLWSRRWVRRVVLLLRVGYLVADVALDIRVTVWLFDDGDTTSAAVCVAFIAATQVVISMALLVNLAHHFFASKLLVLCLSPVLVALGPVLGPVMAIGNLSNSDVPLVFWRYLELVEFCVALLQAPAESVTQSIVYAQQNHMGNGMYMDHPLFIASIILSMGDMLIAALKLCRYKGGPWRRVVVAVTHLDKVRDPLDYRQRLLSSTGSSYYPGPGLKPITSSNFAFGPPPPSPLETPLNPLLPASPGSRRAVRGGAAGGPVSLEPSRSAVVRAGSAATAGVYTPPDVVQATEGAAGPPETAAAAAAAAATAAATAAAAAAVAHTFTPLTAPRYRPSLLAASSQRLGGGGGVIVSSGGGGGGGLGGSASAHSLFHAAHPSTPSRLGPSGGGRHSSVTIPAQPPLRPLYGSPSLPASSAVTPTASMRRSISNADPPLAAAAPGSVAADVWAAAMAAEQELQALLQPQHHPQHARASEGEGGAGGGGSLSRRSRSMQVAPPAAPPPLTSQSPLVGSISSEIYGVGTTGGSGPPPPPPPPLFPRRSAGGGSAGATGAAPTQLSRLASGSSGPSVSASWPAPPPPLPPIAAGGPSSSAASQTSRASGSGAGTAATDAADGRRYLASAAAAAAAALADADGAAAAAAAAAAEFSGGRPGPGAPATPAPAGLPFSPGRISTPADFTPASTHPDAAGDSRGAAEDGRGGATAAAAAASAAGPSSALLRRAQSTAAGVRSANASPARRREGPALSIAVPASPVGGGGIEVIRLSTPSSRHLSPQTSRGAPTPVGWLPQPPQPAQHLPSGPPAEGHGYQAAQPGGQAAPSQPQEPEAARSAGRGGPNGASDEG